LGCHACEPKRVFLGRTVGGRDAAVEPPGTGLRRVLTRNTRFGVMWSTFYLRDRSGRNDNCDPRRNTHPALSSKRNGVLHAQLAAGATCTAFPLVPRVSTAPGIFLSRGEVWPAV